MNSTDSRVTLDLGTVNPDGLELASELTSLACITVLAIALGSKTYGEEMKSINYGRVLVVLLYTLSWAFAATSVIVVSTNNSNLLTKKKKLIPYSFVVVVVRQYHFMYSGDAFL